MSNFTKSIGALAFGVLLALGIAVLVVFGIFWPIAMRFLDPSLSEGAFFPSLFLVLAAAFAFYWGGMISSYRAPGRRKLHGVLVAPVTFAISPVINLLSGEGFFPGLNSLSAFIFMLVILLVATGGAYVGARRGEALFDHNRQYIERRKRQRRDKEKVVSEPERRG